MLPCCGSAKLGIIQSLFVALSCCILQNPAAEYVMLVVLKTRFLLKNGQILRLGNGDCGKPTRRLPMHC